MKNKEGKQKSYEIKKILRFKTFCGNIDSVDYDDLDNYDYNYDFADDDECRKIGSIRTLFKEFDRDYYKPIRTDNGFAGRNNNYIEYTSRGDRHENLSSEEYLKMIRPYLRDLIDDHKPTTESNNEDNNNNNNINDSDRDSDRDNDSDRAEWKMKNNCISTKSFEETCTIYTKSEPTEIFMGSNTNDVIDRLFNTLLQRFQQAIKTSIEGSIFTHESVRLLYNVGLYIMSPNWRVNKKATINPKSERDNKFFQWSIILGLNYNKIKEKGLKKILKFKRVDTDFSPYQRDWEEFEQDNTLIALNVLFVSYNSEKVKLAYKLNCNKHKNQAILLMINDEASNCYYFAKKNLSELNSLGWLRGKKEAIIKDDKSFQNALNGVLNYQTIERHSQRISKLKPYINRYNWEGIEFPAGPKDWIKFERNIKTIALNILFIRYNTKTIRAAYRSDYNNKRKKQVILLMITDGKKCH